MSRARGPTFSMVQSHVWQVGAFKWELPWLGALVPLHVGHSVGCVGFLTEYWQVFKSERPQGNEAEVYGMCMSWPWKPRSIASATLCCSRQSQKPTQIQGKEMWMPSFDRKILEEHVEQEILLQPSSENRICHKVTLF